MNGESDKCGGIQMDFANEGLFVQGLSTILECPIDNCCPAHKLSRARRFRVHQAIGQFLDWCQ